MAVATVNDVAVAVGRPISAGAETEQVQWWLNGVELLIRGRVGSIAALDPNVLQFVEAEAVAAKLRRSGGGESSITVSVDDGSVTRRYENSVSSGDITDEWWALLSPQSDGGSSTRPGFEPDAARWAVDNGTREVWL